MWINIYIQGEAPQTLCLLVWKPHQLVRCISHKAYLTKLEVNLAVLGESRCSYIYICRTVILQLIYVVLMEFYEDAMGYHRQFWAKIGGFQRETTAFCGKIILNHCIYRYHLSKNLHDTDL